MIGLQNCEDYFTTMKIKLIYLLQYTNHNLINLTCLMLRLDTDMIMVGLLQISSGLIHREKMAFCLGDNASFPVLSLDRNNNKKEQQSII